MNGGEFYTSREDNYIGENKGFPAEIYKSVLEENASGPECGDSGPELTTLQRKSKKKRAAGGAEGLVDKLFGSIKGVAVTATVAASAAAVIGTAAQPSPTVELIDIDVGASYVEYELDVGGVSDGEDYYLLVYAPGYEASEEELDADGRHGGRVDGLKPEWEYTLSLVRRDAVLGDITHFSHKFQTEKYDPPMDPPDPPTDPPEPPAPAPPPDSYGGAYEVPMADTARVDWTAEEIVLPVVFEKLGDAYYYRLTVYGTDGGVLQTVTGDTGGEVRIGILNGVDTYRFGFEIYGVKDATERLLISADAGELTLARPRVEVTEFSIIAENYIRIDFEAENTESFELLLTCADGSEKRITPYPSEIRQGYIEFPLPKDTPTVSVTPLISVGDGTVIEGERSEKTFTENLGADVLVNVDPYYASLTLMLKAVTNGADRLSIRSSESDGEYFEYLYGAPIYIGYDTRGEITYTMYLTNEAGEQLSNILEFTVDTTEREIGTEYEIKYPNPSDVGLTFNDDGTMNVYYNFAFDTADETLYYVFNVGARFIKTKDAVGVIRRVAYGQYGCPTYVCKEVDGIQYVVSFNNPSGVVNEFNSGADCTLNGNEVSVYISEYSSVLLDRGVRLVSSLGEEIELTADDFAPGASGEGGYYATVLLENPPEWVDMTVVAERDAAMLEGVGEYDGNLYSELTISVYSSY